ncbi:MAG: type II toxin-antitoxin system YhaV family toxin [Candidatus Acidiferrales bacterium]
MEVNGWRLFQYPLFENQLRKLTEAVEQLSSSQPDTYREHPKTKLLATIHRYITEIIPRDPNAPEFRQGDTLGPDNRHWFRAKFHHRYRLFFRFSTKDRVIVYVWVNDEFTLRKAGSRTDAYAVFKSTLNAGDPPRTLEILLKRAKEMKAERKRSKAFPGTTD